MNSCKPADSWRLSDEEMKAIMRDCTEPQFIKAEPYWWLEQNRRVRDAACKKLAEKSLEWLTERLHPREMWVCQTYKDKLKAENILPTGKE